MSSSRSPSLTPISRSIPLPDSSSSGSNPKVPSPLNPASTPTKSSTPLPISDGSVSSSLTTHQRVHSASVLPDESKSRLSMTVSAPHGEGSSSLSLPVDFDGESMKSTFRERSLSPARAEANLSSSWWGEKHVSRPWQDGQKRKNTVPAEQTEALECTRKKVAKAVASALETGADVVHEALFLSVELLEFAPVPGLQVAAKTLLNIWDAAQEVDMNRLSCLRLTERCADILISVREEVYEAGDVIGQDLALPIAKLEESYMNIYRFMLKQTNRPWLKRYLRRDEILRDISGCDSALRDSLALFGISIQIRILKQAREAEKRREAEMQDMLKAILNGRLPPPNPDMKMISGIETDVTSAEHTPYVFSTNYFSETITQFATTSNALGLIQDGNGSFTPTKTLIPAIESLHTVENSLDAARDLSDLRQLMRAALQTSSDAELVDVLQIGRQEMPDAIKTLQRALERLAERDGDGTESTAGKGIVLGKVVRRVSLKEGSEGGLKRSTTVVSVESSSSSSTSIDGSSNEIRRKDTLDWEFIESGIDALRRMSRGVDTSLPSWTITKYEVDRDEKIGIGFFSDVFKGTWRGRTVAIKVLAESTPRKLFIREMGIWKTLRHPNVLQLYGASSATGDPPWFFVSPYLKNGSLVEHLKRVEHEERPSGLGVGIGANQMSPSSPFRSPGGRAVTLPSPWRGTRGASPGRETTPGSRGKTPPRDNSEIQREWDLFRFMHEIAKGMAYLHGQGVLHGDLKAANVLVDDKYRCVISDFGQSEMKSEAYRISGALPPHGTLRWQAPELMAGQSQLSPEMDVWAFSICCVEILTMGRMPWPLMDDDSVRHFVLKDNTRPPIPRNSRFNIPGLQDILRTCWNVYPEQRPKFTKIARDLKLLRKSFGQEVLESPRFPSIEDFPEHTSSPSPDMRPIGLPQFLQGTGVPPPHDILVGSLNSDSPFHTARDSCASPALEGFDIPHHESTVATEDIKMPEPVIYMPGPSSRHSSIFLPATHSDEHINVIDYDGYESPPPIDERIANLKNERRYRLLLTHDYHPSLTLPLWDPSPVELGAVGYLSKPRGAFITLFNAYNPKVSAHPAVQVLPSIEGYGRPPHNYQRQDRRSVTQRAFDIFAGSLTFRNTSQNVSRRYSFPLKTGHKVAYLCTETTEYRYMETLEAPKAWFQRNVEAIIKAYGGKHHIQKEDLFLVIGTLRTPNYALFVSHSHPEGQAHFNVYSNPKNGHPWGTFTTDTDVSRDFGGPSYDSEGSGEIPRLSASKVSNHGGPWDAVLLARLRFKPDVLEPTSK